MQLKPGVIRATELNFDTDHMWDAPAHLGTVALAYALLFVLGAAGQWCIHRTSAAAQAWGTLLVGCSSILVLLSIISVPAYGVWELPLPRWVLRVLCIAIAGAFFYFLRVTQRRLVAHVSS